MALLLVFGARQVLHFPTVFNSMFFDTIAVYSQFVIVYTRLHVRFEQNGEARKKAKTEWKSDLIQFYGILHAEKEQHF